MSSKPTPADHYRELAAAASAAAAATELPHVRVKHELAAERWAVLAAAEDVRVAEQDRRHAMRRDRLSEQA
jgi:hypothetical protein